MPFAPDSAPCFLAFHSPSPSALRPVESITRSVTFPLDGCLYVIFTVRDHLLAQLSSGAHSGTFINANRELSSPVVARRVGLTIPLIIRKAEMVGAV